jgi:prefoldin subunit 5
MASPLEVGLNLMIEQTITVGNIIEIIVIGAGGIGVFFTLKSTVANIKREVEDIQKEIKKLGDILVAQADIRGEIKVINTRITSAEQDIREMRHGEGFVKGARGIDREYP